jgi:hypothetical protein
MNRKSQKTVAVDSFSGALSAIATETEPGDRQSHCFPEHSRPHSKVNIFVYSHVRSIVGHQEVESRNFAFKDLKIIKSKDIWQEPSLT